MIGLLTGIAVRKNPATSRRAPGIHPATLYRREKKARMKLMLEGRYEPLHRWILRRCSRGADRASWWPLSRSRATTPMSAGEDGL